MRTIKILAILLTVIYSSANAQSNEKPIDQERKIEINNDNGNLTIAFKNGDITAFIVNDIPVSKERYDNYQEIIDDFSDEEMVQEKDSFSLDNEEENKTERLNKLMINYLINNGYINSFRKYKVQMKKTYLKIDGKKMPPVVHDICLDFFYQVYDQKLNAESEVYFKKSGDNSKSSIKIVDQS